MARVWMRMLKMMMLFSGLLMSSLTFDIHLVTVNPKQAISGVIEASIGNQYALNASAARDLCEHLGLTIASKAQVAEAQKHGLETCRFGWIDEQIAVVPRVQVKSNCGSGKTGVVVWRANPSTEFDVFCFNLRDFEAQNQASMTAHQTTRRKPITTHSSVFPTAQAGVHLRKTPFSKLPSPSSSLSSLSTSVPPSLSHSPSVYHMDDEGKHLPMSGTPVEAVPAALLITVTFAVMLAVFLAIYYFKTNRPCRTQCDSEQQKEYIETEVWEHCSKKDLQNPQEEHVEENEEENNNSSSTGQD
ncbi:lymphatic vessel endothelial hyaluronic acid receptor 1-like [Sinocyclocheilus anshuiensis]|uniref:Lymphatic vessel endothelial hyaluronic acid receptor 1-like n=1 Tax=Sinocyclocheilus anshuiensis TaxID=1608454 RepID=A0A671PMA6_9TELE|nr:PREDICTED: lymphatic vessel endothelial hyaluronic acid receptor 1-like [Sinocyclocheilus anshuiensis]